MALRRHLIFKPVPVTSGANVYYRHLMRKNTSGAKHLVCGPQATDTVYPDAERGIELWATDGAVTASAQESVARSVYNAFRNAAASAWVAPSAHPVGWSRIPFMWGNGALNVINLNAPASPASGAYGVCQAYRFTVPAAYSSASVCGVRLMLSGLGTFAFDAPFAATGSGNVAKLSDWRTSHSGLPDAFHVRFTVAAALPAPYAASEAAHGSFDLEDWTDATDTPFCTAEAGSNRRFVPIGDSLTEHELDLADTAAEIVDANRTFWLVVTPGFIDNDPSSLSWWEFESAEMAMYSVKSVGVRLLIG